MRKVTNVKRRHTFDVEHFSLSSYATQEVNGKFSISGMFSDQVVVPEKASNWPPLYILLVLIPQSTLFEYILKIVDTHDEELLRFEATYQNNNDVDKRERLALCVPLPQFPMKNHGMHWFEISDGSSVVLRRGFELVSAEPTDVIFGQQTLKVRIGATGQTRVIQ